MGSEMCIRDSYRSLASLAACSLVNVCLCVCLRFKRLLASILTNMGGGVCAIIPSNMNVLTDLSVSLYFLENSVSHKCCSFPTLLTVSINSGLL